MPLLGGLLASIANGVSGLFVAMFGAVWGVRVAAAITLAGIYVSCVVYYTTMITPWLDGLLTHPWVGMLGLLFPPVAGSCLASLAAFYTCIVGKRYISSLTKLAVK